MIPDLSSPATSYSRLQVYNNGHYPKDIVVVYKYGHYKEKRRRTYTIQRKMERRKERRKEGKNEQFQRSGSEVNRH